MPKEEETQMKWVVEALGGKVVKKRGRENHKYDEVRADKDIKWCPECRRKWEIYEGELWASRDRKLYYEEKICPDCEQWEEDLCQNYDSPVK